MSFVGTMPSQQSARPQISNDSHAWQEFDVLAAVVSRYQQVSRKNKSMTSPEHRISCHRCGNIRKRRILCTSASCPHTFCGRCAEKMKDEHGDGVFDGGCPVCKDLCCCSNKTVSCDRRNHCYRKCPATKSFVPKGGAAFGALKSKSIDEADGNTGINNATNTSNTDSDEGDSTAESGAGKLCLPVGSSLAGLDSFATAAAVSAGFQSPARSDGGQYGIFELRAAVADMDKQAARELQMNEFLNITQQQRQQEQQEQQKQQEQQEQSTNYSPKRSSSNGRDVRELSIAVGAVAGAATVGDDANYLSEDDLGSPRKRMKKVVLSPRHQHTPATAGAAAPTAGAVAVIRNRFANQESPQTVPMMDSSSSSHASIAFDGSAASAAIAAGSESLLPPSSLDGFAPSGAAASTGDTAALTANGAAVPASSSSSSSSSSTAAMSLLALVSSLSHNMETTQKT